MRTNVGAAMDTGFFGAHGDEVTGHDRAELVQKLSGVDIRVPGRTEGRRSHHRERRCLVRYLETLAVHERLFYPLTVERVRKEDEPPDFILTFGERETTVALEIVEAGTQRSQQAATESEKRPPGTMLEGEATLVAPGDVLTGAGWMGDELEREWASLVMEHIQLKEATLHRFQPADQHHLLVYDNSHLVYANLVDAAPFLVSELSERQGTDSPHQACFSLISVLQDDALLHDVLGEHSVLRVDR